MFRSYVLDGPWQYTTSFAVQTLYISQGIVGLLQMYRIFATCCKFQTFYKSVIVIVTLFCSIFLCYFNTLLNWPDTHVVEICNEML